MPDSIHVGAGSGIITGIVFLPGTDAAATAAAVSTDLPAIFELEGELLLVGMELANELQDDFLATLTTAMKVVHVGNHFQDITGK